MADIHIPRTNTANAYHCIIAPYSSYVQTTTKYDNIPNIMFLYIHTAYILEYYNNAVVSQLNLRSRKKCIQLFLC